jgi:hypothetical protein
MLVICLVIVAVVLIPVLARFAEGDNPGGGFEQHQQDEPHQDDDAGMLASLADAA